jgi:hypothetical protein
VKVVAHLREHVSQERVAKAVEDLVALLAAFDNVPVPQDGQVLGGIGLLDADALAQLAHGHLGAAEKLDDGDARGVGQGLKNPGLELPHGLQHRSPGSQPMISIFEYAN